MTAKKRPKTEGEAKKNVKFHAAIFIHYTTLFFLLAHFAGKQQQQQYSCELYTNILYGDKFGFAPDM